MGGLDKYKAQGLHTHTKNTPDLKALLKMIDSLPPYVGAPPFPRDKEGFGVRQIVLIANFIMKRYNYLTSEEVVEAFELGAVGDLYQDGKAVDISSFGRMLNITLVGKVLTAYKKYRQEKRMRPQVISHEKRLEAPKYEPVTAEFHYNHLVAEVKKTGKLPVIHLWETVYTYMVEQGKAPKLEKWALNKYGNKTKGSLAYILKNAPWRLIVQDAFYDLGWLERPQTEPKPKTDENGQI